MILCWTPGGREFAGQWADWPVGLEEAVRRAIQRFEARERTHRLWASWYAAERIGAQVMDPRAVLRIVGI